MKRLVSVMILAGVPIACGTQMATTPDEGLSVLPESGSVSALKAGPGPAPRCVVSDRSAVKSIDLVVVGRTKGSVTVRAVDKDSETYPPVCLFPSWTVTPVARLDPFVDREQVIVSGAPGRYKLTGVVVVDRLTRLTASMAITIE